MKDYKDILTKKLDLGAVVKNFIEHDGFKVLEAKFENFKNDYRIKRYKTFEEYNAAMDAIDLVDGLINELKSCVNDAEQAEADLLKLIERESLTPSLSLDGEGNDEGQEA